MATITEIFSPSFVLFPCATNRTAWRPFGFPVLLIEPYRRDGRGNPIANSGVTNVRIVIEETPRKTLVAGHDHVGLLHPSYDLYSRTISTVELYDRLIDPTIQTFYNAQGVEIDYNDARQGDFMSYTALSGVKDTIDYIPTANYYDLSDLTVETEELPPKHYYLSYRADYFCRLTVTGRVEELRCIDPTRPATAVRRFEINHPGEIISETVRLTPDYMLGNAKKSQDEIIGLYRPLTDILQDIYDEQTHLGQINWVDKIAPQYMPYLAYLLGLDIPYYPNTIKGDQLRRTVLKNAVRLQQLKGSRRAIIELFELFGYSIYLHNLYWSSDGKRFIRPGQALPAEYESQEIGLTEVTQIEPLLAEYDTEGWGNLRIPLLYRSARLTTHDGVITAVDNSEIKLDAYLVEVNSIAHTELTALVDGMNADLPGYGESVGVLPVITSDGIIGYSQLTLSGQNGIASDLTSAGQIPPLSISGSRFDRRTGIVYLTFDNYLYFSRPNAFEPSAGSDRVLFVFASYTRPQLAIPEAIADLRSNRFDLQILTRSGEQVAAEALEFLIDYLFKLKAFHSLLNVIIYSQQLDEVYQVTDFSVGGDYEQRYTTDAGKLQVPAAVLPLIPVDGECVLSPQQQGYKDEDLAMRNRVLTGLHEEHQAWKRLDGRETAADDKLRLPVPEPRGDACQYNYRGQDRYSTPAGAIETVYETKPSPTACGDFTPSMFGRYTSETEADTDSYCVHDGVTDYSWKGRVRDGIAYQQRIVATEVCSPRICGISLGSGAYYITPSGGIVYTDGITDEPSDVLNHLPLNIEMASMPLPGTRFPVLSKLEEDFEHDTWRARPWDDIYADRCGDSTFLNAVLVENELGDLVLSFDDEPFTVLGNGFVPDIPSLGDHTGDILGSSVIHRVYSTASAGHPAITFDDVDFTSESTIEIDEALFPSASQCGTGIVDFIDGYPSLSGLQNLPDQDFDRDGLYTELFDALEIPDEPATGTQALFFLSSGIRSGSGIRLDCGCSAADCGSLAADARYRLTCPTTKFLVGGEYDFSPDHIEIEQSLVFESKLDCRDLRLDGSIPSLFELV